MITLKPLFARHATTALGITVFAAVMLAALVTEIFLRMFMPFSIATIGHVNADNAERYGWGFSPFEIITIRDPDTGKSMRSRMNAYGWRDRVRTRENKNSAYRILVLGDSGTFAPIVPDDKMYTRILEKNLQKQGYNIEVINISYGGWGTDHELEALQAEGLLYKPDIIIVQFCSNDLSDNTQTGELGKHKPFLYRLDASGVLHRDRHHSSTNRDTKGRLEEDSLLEAGKKFFRGMEIIKRCYALYLHIQLVEQAVQKPQQSLKYFPRPNALKKLISSSDATEYYISKKQLEQLKLALNLDATSGLFAYLKPLAGKSITAADLRSAIAANNATADTEAIERILEKRWFHHYWSKEHFFCTPQDASSYEWQLYFAIVLRMQKLAEQHGSHLLLFDEKETGAYAWERYWHRISPDISADDFLSQKIILKDFAQKNGIGFIPNEKVYQRARNDSHPNSKGNEAMAEDIERYLLKHYGADLERFRQKPETATSLP